MAWFVWLFLCSNGVRVSVRFSSSASSSLVARRSLVAGLLVSRHAAPATRERHEARGTNATQAQGRPKNHQRFAGGHYYLSSELANWRAREAGDGEAGNGGREAGEAGQETHYIVYPPTRLVQSRIGSHRNETNETNGRERDRDRDRPLIHGSRHRTIQPYHHTTLPISYHHITISLYHPIPSHNHFTQEIIVLYGRETNEKTVDK